METDPTVALYKFIPWFQANSKKVAVGVGVVVVIAVVIGYSTWSKEQNKVDANLALMAVPSLLIPNPDVPGDAPPSGKLLAIASEYSGTGPGEAAQLLAARALFMETNFPQAQAAFSKFIAENPDSPLIPQARVGVAQAMEAQGKTTEAMQEFKTIDTLYANLPSVDRPVKLTLGRLSEAEKPSDAVGYYSRLASIGDRRDPWVTEATERLRLLLAKHPELNPNREQPQAPGVTAPSVLAPSASEMNMMAPPGGAPTPTPAPITVPGATNQAAPK